MRDYRDCCMKESVPISEPLKYLEPEPEPNKNLNFKRIKSRNIYNQKVPVPGLDAPPVPPFSPVRRGLYTKRLLSTKPFTRRLVKK